MTSRAGKPYIWECIRMLPSKDAAQPPGARAGTWDLSFLQPMGILGGWMSSGWGWHGAEDRGDTSQPVSKSDWQSTFLRHAQKALAQKAQLMTRHIILMSSRVWLRGEWKEFLNECRQPLCWRESLQPHTSGQHCLLSDCLSHWKEEAGMKGTFPHH